MRKINLGKLRCSTHSSANSQSPSGSSTRNQSQTTISSFFVSKPCSRDSEGDSVAGKSKADGKKLTGAKGAKVGWQIRQ